MRCFIPLSSSLKWGWEVCRAIRLPASQGLIMIDTHQENTGLTHMPFYTTSLSAPAMGQARTSTWERNALRLSTYLKWSYKSPNTVRCIPVAAVTNNLSRVTFLDCEEDFSKFETWANGAKCSWSEVQWKVIKCATRDSWFETWLWTSISSNTQSSLSPPGFPGCYSLCLEPQPTPLLRVLPTFTWTMFPNSGLCSSLLLL